MGKIYQNDNQLLLQELIVIYKPEDFDWLSYQITRNNILTLHHVIKAADGGELKKENAALLTKKSHRALHICESIYSEINDFFREIIAFNASLDDYLKKRIKRI